MLLRTHLAFAFLMIFLFIKSVNNKILFFLIVIIATILPDLDNPKSSWGRHLIFKPLQIFTKHRGILHSFTTAIIISIILAVIWPMTSFGFFLGYSVHLICDSFTKDGIQPFWPLKYKSSGPLKTGGRIEESLFLILVFLDLFLATMIWIFI